MWAYESVFIRFIRLGSAEHHLKMTVCWNIELKK